MIESYKVRSNNRASILKMYKTIDTNLDWCIYRDSKYLLVSRKGVLRSLYSNKELKQQTTKQGYKLITYRTLRGGRSTKLVHRLVAETYIPCLNYDFLEVNHIDGNKSNNCVSNLEWTTRKENLQHARNSGLFKRQMGKSNGRFKYSNKLVSDIKKDKENNTIKELQLKYKMTKRQLTHILYRR